MAALITAVVLMDFREILVRSLLVPETHANMVAHVQSLMDLMSALVKQRVDF